MTADRRTKLLWMLAGVTAGLMIGIIIGVIGMLRAQDSARQVTYLTSIVAAGDALGAGDPEKAKELLFVAIAFYPDAYMGYISLGDIYAAQADYERAAAMYRKALELTEAANELPDLLAIDGDRLDFERGVIRKKLTDLGIEE